jgi:hypothetical protein
VADRSKSEAIRRVLEAVPEIRPAHAQAILAKKGIDISQALFRVVKKNWLRDCEELKAAERKYEEYWTPEEVGRRAEERARHEERREAEVEEKLQDRLLAGRPAQELGEPLLLEDLRFTSLDMPPLTPRPSPPTEERRRLTIEQKHDLLSRVQRSFDPMEWAKIVAHDRDAERVIAEDLAQDYSYGMTPEEAVERVVDELQRQSKLNGEIDRFDNAKDFFDENV